MPDPFLEIAKRTTKIQRAGMNRENGDDGSQMQGTTFVMGQSPMV